MVGSVQMEPYKRIFGFLFYDFFLWIVSSDWRQSLDVDKVINNLVNNRWPWKKMRLFWSFHDCQGKYRSFFSFSLYFLCVTT